MSVYYKIVSEKISWFNHKYELGKTYKCDGDLEFNRVGFHCYKNPLYGLNMFPFEGELFEVEIGSEYIEKDNVTISRSFKPVRKITGTERNRLLTGHVYDENTGRETWFINGKLHRDQDKPAFIWYSVSKKSNQKSKYWYQNGELHREGDQPAVITSAGTQEWYKHGKRHRDGDNPAVITYNGIRRWYKNGVLHREGNPAVILNDDVKFWFLNGELIKPVEN